MLYLFLRKQAIIMMLYEKCFTVKSVRYTLQDSLIMIFYFLIIGKKNKKCPMKNNRAFKLVYRVIHLASVKFENGIVVPVLPFVQSICGKYYPQTEIGLCENYTH